MVNFDPLIGKQLGNYRLSQKLGQGACGVVYASEHIKLGTPFAVKILHPILASHDESAERFMREAQTTARIGHENVVFIADYDIDYSIGPYFVMEYLEGESLEERLTKQGALPLPQIVDLAGQICHALTAAHEAGVIHRDLKPANIYLLPRMGRDLVKVLDFGIAKISRDAGPSQIDLTQNGRILGTPRYIAPEQARGAAVDHRADMYAFGLVLYEMLTGEPCFTGRSPEEIIVQHLSQTPPRLDPQQYTPALQEVLDQLLSKHQDQRPDDMNEVWRQLQRAFVGLTHNPQEGHSQRSTDTVNATAQQIALNETNGYQEEHIPRSQRVKGLNETLQFGSSMQQLQAVADMQRTSPPMSQEEAASALDAILREMPAEPAPPSLDGPISTLGAAEPPTLPEVKSSTSSSMLSQEDGSTQDGAQRLLPLVGDPFHQEMTVRQAPNDSLLSALPLPPLVEADLSTRPAPVGEVDSNEDSTPPATLSAPTASEQGKQEPEHTTQQAAPAFSMDETVSNLFADTPPSESSATTPVKASSTPPQSEVVTEGFSTSPAPATPETQTPALLQPRHTPHSLSALQPELSIESGDRPSTRASRHTPIQPISTTLGLHQANKDAKDSVSHQHVLAEVAPHKDTPHPQRLPLPPVAREPEAAELTWAAPLHRRWLSRWRSWPAILRFGLPLLVVAALSTFFFFSNTEAPPATPKKAGDLTANPTQETCIATLALDTRPVSASVWLQGKKRGSTPFLYKGKCGELVLVEFRTRRYYAKRPFRLLKGRNEFTIPLRRRRRRYRRVRRRRRRRASHHSKRLPKTLSLRSKQSLSVYYERSFLCRTPCLLHTTSGRKKPVLKRKSVVAQIVRLPQLRSKRYMRLRLVSKKRTYLFHKGRYVCRTPCIFDTARSRQRLLQYKTRQKTQRIQVRTLP